MYFVMLWWSGVIENLGVHSVLRYKGKGSDVLKYRKNYVVWFMDIPFATHFNILCKNSQYSNKFSDTILWNYFKWLNNSMNFLTFHFSPSITNTLFTKIYFEWKNEKILRWENEWKFPSWTKHREKINFDIFRISLLTGLRENWALENSDDDENFLFIFKFIWFTIQSCGCISYNRIQKTPEQSFKFRFIIQLWGKYVCE
jgi:hypothetical protein